MRKLKSVCVYCGSREGNDPAFVKEAKAFGRALAKRRVRLVYGGASIGMMGTLARSVLQHGGEVTGIIPGFLTALETPLDTVTERVLTESMHERKQAMFDMSDAFIVMPGGIGTLEEAFEIITWRQLHRHKKPVVFVNINGYWDSLVALLNHVVSSGFAAPDLISFFHVVDAAADILPLLDKLLPGAIAEQQPHLEEL